MISQRLSLNMPRLNQNQRIQALTMLARGDNVSNVSRAFGCHRNTIIRLRQCFQKTGGVADRCRSGRPRVTNPRTDRFITLTRLRRRFETATSFARQYGIYRKTDSVAPHQASPATHSAKETLCGTSAYSKSSGCPFAVGIFVGGDSSVLRFHSLMSLGLTLVIKTVEFEFLEEEGNVLLIIVSLRGTDLEVGVYGMGWHYGQKENKSHCCASQPQCSRLHIPDSAA